jgi:hypothetical protein
LQSVDHKSFERMSTRVSRLATTVSVRSRDLDIDDRVACGLLRSNAVNVADETPIRPIGLCLRVELTDGRSPRECAVGWSVHRRLRPSRLLP